MKTVLILIPCFIRMNVAKIIIAARCRATR